MDPLSIIASVIAICQAVSFSAEKARRFYGAENELLELVNEISDLRLMLGEVERMLKHRAGDKNFHAKQGHTISTVLERAVTELQILQETLDRGVYQLNPKTGKHKIRHVSWIRQKSKVQQLQKQLRSTREILSTLCSSATLSDTSDIQLQLDGLFVLQNDHKAQLGQQTKFIEVLLQHYQYLEPVQRIDQDSHSSRRLSETAGSDTTLVDDDSDDDMFYDTTEFMSQCEPDLEKGLSLGECQSPVATTGSVRIQATRHTRVRCGEWCSCRCHAPQAIKTPNVASTFLGSLFIGYTGFPALSQKCTESTCRGHAASSLKVTYYFPGWFMSRMLHFAVRSFPAGGPRVALSLPRVVPDNAEIFSCAVRGDLDGMKSLFERGLASPFDIGIGTGRSPLHYAVNYDNVATARFLIDAGANAQTEDMEHATAVALAWRRIFGSLGPPSDVDALRYMFDDGDFLDSRVFQPLHKIVLGLSSESLESQLKLSTASINAVDADGRTALSWAATRGDFDAVRTILAFGADPNLPSYRGQTPLHFAVQNRRPNVMIILEELIAHGANVNAIDYWNRTPLTYASGNHAALTPVELLVSCGTALNVRDRRLRTAIGYAARLGSCIHTEHLLSAGADPDIPDEFNVLPMLEAVKNNYHDILSLLLPVSFPLQTQPFGTTLLHWIAAYADARTLDIILSVPSLGHLFEGFELTMENDKGSTPQDLFVERKEAVTLDLEEKFQRLVRRISYMD